MTDSEHRIFFSHDARAKPFVSRVAAELRRRGIDPWIADERLDPGQDWEEQLSDALASSDALVVFIDRGANSPNTYFEIGAAVGGSKRVVPVYLTDDTSAASSFLSEMAGISASSLTPDEVASRIADAVTSTTTP
jgi:hypothetical protein